MNYIVYFYVVNLIVITLLTIPYIRWSTLLKDMQDVKPTSAFVSQVKFNGNKAIYNLIFSYDGLHRNIWVSKGIGNPTLTSTIPIVVLPSGRFSKDGIQPITMKYIVGRTHMYINIIMILMAINATIVIISDFI